MRSLGEHLRGDTDLVSPALSVSPAYVKKAFRKVARHGGKPAREMTPKELHQLRIDFKGLRYTCEFFAGLYEGAMNPVIAGVKAFQDCLGAFQDAQVARETLSDLLDGFRSETDLPDRILLDLGALIQVEREISIERREEFISLWEKLDALRKSLEKTLASG
jgi:CHAD domain-containing protein